MVGRSIQVRAAAFAVVAGTAAAAVLMSAASGGGTGVAAEPTVPLHQVATWGASALSDRTGLSFQDQTFRDVVHTDVGGQNLRIRLSNAYGNSTVTFTDVYVGRQASGAEIVAGTNRQATFGDSTSVTLYPGTEAYSDPLPGTVGPAQNLVVSIYLPGASGRTTNHWRSEQTTYVSTPGDHADDTSAAAFPQANDNTVWWYLDGVSVEAGPTVHTVVAFGDSITDGYQSSLDTNHRYPDDLAARLLAQPGPRQLGVLNEGIAGNQVITGMLSRLDRDVLSQPDVSTVIYLGGINDIGVDRTADQLIAADEQIIARLHARGIRVLGATLTPFGGSSTYDASREQTREALNTWIRDGGQFDGVVDFDHAVRDPADPATLLAGYDSGDHLHPNDAGYSAMADAVDLESLR